MTLGLTVPGATRRIRGDPRSSTAVGAYPPSSPVALAPALDSPTGAPLPALGPVAAIGSRSS